MTNDSTNVYDEYVCVSGFSWNEAAISLTVAKHQNQRHFRVSFLCENGAQRNLQKRA